MAQDPLQQTYDAVVVGSGATGGWAAKQLAEAGLKVALLEAGRAVSPKEFTEHMPAYKLKYRDHSPDAKAVLCVHGIQLRVVCERPRESI
jgi:choline dehydrogenase-like flavoprotein